MPDPDAEPGGWPDYAGEFDPGFQLEDLSHRALVIVNQEVAVQSHLLARAFMLCGSQREGDATATELGTSQWTGIAALTAERLRRAMKIDADKELFTPGGRPLKIVDGGQAIGEILS